MNRSPKFFASCCTKVLLCTNFLLLSAGADAFQDRVPGVYVEGGAGSNSTSSIELGLVLPWAPRPSFESGAQSLYWDVFLSEWRAPLPGDTEHRNYTQIGGILNWRYRFGDGTSPWFAEAGFGASMLNALYRTPSHEFSTRFQFTEQLGFGRSFGAGGAHEVSLRFQHFSNGGIKEPNPGENFLRVRYLYRF